MQDNVAAALCYLLGWLTGVLFLVLAPYNTNKAIRFHAFQSIFLSIAWIVVWIGVMILTAMLAFITPFLGAIILPCVGIGAFVLWLLLMYKAYNNEQWELPIIGALARKQA
jgi:uncharacterized membrane protein